MTAAYRNNQRFGRRGQDLRPPPGGAHSVLPARVSDDRRLADADLRLLLAFSALLNRFGETTAASVNDIIACTDMGRATVFRCLKKLEACGWIKREPRFHPYSGARLSNAYLLQFNNQIPPEHDRMANLARATRNSQSGRAGPSIGAASPALRQDAVVQDPASAGLSGGTVLVSSDAPPRLTDETEPVPDASPPRPAPETAPVSDARPLNMEVKSINLSHQESLPSMAIAMAMHGEAPATPRENSEGRARAMATAKAGMHPGDQGEAGGDTEPRPAGVGSEAIGLASEFAELRRECFPSAPRRAPPKSAETIQGWIDAGGSVELIREVIWEQMNALKSRGILPNSPSLLSSDVLLAIGQERHRTARAGSAVRTAPPSNPWHQTDNRLRLRLLSMNRVTAGLIGLRKRAELAGLQPTDLEALFDRHDAWRERDPVSVVASIIARSSSDGASQ